MDAALQWTATETGFNTLLSSTGEEEGDLGRKYGNDPKWGIPVRALWGVRQAGAGVLIGAAIGVCCVVALGILVSDGVCWLASPRSR